MGSLVPGDITGPLYLWGTRLSLESWAPHTIKPILFSNPKTGGQGSNSSCSDTGRKEMHAAQLLLLYTLVVKKNCMVI
jgi:hypothetical protein